MDNTNQQQIQDDEISLKELIILVQTYIQECLKSWLLIVIMGIGLGLLFGFRAYRSDRSYTATVSYTTSEGNGLGSLAGGLVGRFIGGGKSNPIVKMQGMVSSRKIMERVVFQKVIIDGKKDFLINHHAKLFEFEKNEKLEFKPFKEGKLITLKENEAFLLIHKQINEGFLSQNLDEDISIASISITSVSEEYSYVLSSVLFKELESFYIDSEIGQQQNTLEKLQLRADSVYNEIEKITYSIARLSDFDRGRVFNTDKVPELKAQAELSFLKTLYEEIIKNLEAIKFTVESATPSIKAIDMPMLPLETKGKGTIKKTITGGFLGGFLAVLFIVGRKVLRDVMSDDEEE
jgi:hypothetical protein